MTGAILVVGGYGAVGALLCEDLAGLGLPLVIAGRNPQKAEALAARLGATTRHFDVAHPMSWPDGIRGVRLVVMCIDQTTADLVAFLCDRGIDYVDVTASDGLFRQLEQLRPGRSSVLLSVGLAPGLTNMLARHLVARFDHIGRFDIGMLFGLGDQHGEAGLDWMAAQIFDPARPHDPLRQDFGRPWGRRVAHVVDFSDQHALMRSFPSTIATTRVAFDSPFATAALFSAATWFGRRPLVRRIARASFSAFRLGSRAVVVAVNAHGLRHGQPTRASIRFVAEDESRTTARLAGLMIRHVLSSGLSPGVWHSHDVLESARLLADIAAEGIGRIEGTAHPTEAMMA